MRRSSARSGGSDTVRKPAERVRLPGRRTEGGSVGASGKQNKARPAFVIAFCSLMAALGTAIMLTSGLIPILTYCSPLAAGLLLIPILCEFGRGHAWMTWIVTAVLSLLLCPDKEAAFFYFFLGYYPIVKQGVDRVRSGVLRFLAKLALFAISLALMYGLLVFVLRLDALMEEMRTAGVLFNVGIYLALVAVMMIYDRVIPGMWALYRMRLRPKLRLQR